MANAEQSLIGKKITKIYIDKEAENLQIDTTDGQSFLFVTDADCCSHTYISEILGVNSVLEDRYTISSIEDMDLGSSGDSELKSYGIRIRTTYEYESWPNKEKVQADGASLLLIYRNESNGYYGGSACLTVGAMSGEKRIELKENFDYDDSKN